MSRLKKDIINDFMEDFYKFEEQREQQYREYLEDYRKELAEQAKPSIEAHNEEINSIIDNIKASAVPTVDQVKEGNYVHPNELKVALENIETLQLEMSLLQERVGKLEEYIRVKEGKN